MEDIDKFLGVIIYIKLEYVYYNHGIRHWNIIALSIEVNCQINVIHMCFSRI